MYDMTIPFHTDQGKCLYEQIYEHIRDEIRRGKLLCGEQLPSTRTLAEYLQVSRNTVDFAYEQLVSEGYIEARERKGYFVCRMEEIPPIGVLNESPVNASYKRWEKQNAAGGENGKAALPKSDHGNRDLGKNGVLIDFHPNGLDMSAFPFGVWKKITKNILNDSNKELFSLGSPQGDYDLRETISRYLHASRGVNCTPEQIVVGAGNDYLLLLLEKLLGRHIGIAMENPTYKRAYRIFQSFAYRIETVGMDENGMLAEELYEHNVQAAYVMPSHQYPTGITMPIGRRMELLKWAAGGEERYLIEDDYDSEFRFRGKPIPSLQGVDQNGRVIYIGTFSKAIAPAIRVSFMVLPERLLKRYQENGVLYASTVSRIDQRVLNEFIRDGYFERYLNKTRKLYREKHDCMLEGLKPFMDRFSLSGEDAGLHILLTAKRAEDTEEELLRKAAAAGVRVHALSDACIAPFDAPFSPAVVMLGYGGLTLSEIRDGLMRLQEAWL